MRREYLFSLLGFLGGFVVAGIIFWQVAAQPGSVSQQVASAVSPPREAAAASPGEHPQRRLGLTTRESGSVAPVAESAPKPQSAAEVFQEAMEKMQDRDPTRRHAAIQALMKRLQAFGTEGLQVLQNYFRAGQDVRFFISYDEASGKSLATLRIALLDTLGDWPGNEALDLIREVMRTTPHMSEASIAITQIEKKSQGVYRAEAIQMFLELAAKQVGKNSLPGDQIAIFDAMKQLKSIELLPAAEAAAAKNVWATSQFISSLGALPADVRASALQQHFANEDVKKGMAKIPWVMQGLNYSEPVVARSMAEVFSSSTDKKFREGFLVNFVNPDPMSFVGHEASTANKKGESASDRLERLQGRLAFLNAVAPQCDTPVLQERLQDARDALQKAIANPVQQEK